MHARLDALPSRRGFLGLAAGGAVAAGAAVLSGCALSVAGGAGRVLGRMHQGSADATPAERRIDVEIGEPGQQLRPRRHVVEVDAGGARRPPLPQGDQRQRQRTKVGVG